MVTKNKRQTEILKIYGGVIIMSPWDFCKYRDERMFLAWLDSAKQKYLYDKINLVNTGKRITNKRVLVLYKQELQQINRNIQCCFKDKVED